jgi:L-aminopeptidase/D-esterase-like protein
MREATETRRPVRGVRIGHADVGEGTTGVTAVLFDRPTPVVADLRGGASATYDTGSLSLEATFGRRWGLFLAGGSVHGLDAARGVREWILESGGGTTFFQNPFPIAPVSGAALFDLPTRPGALADYRTLGHESARRAGPGPVPVGRVGAGAGAMVGKYRGRAAAMRGGIGWSSSRFAPGRIGALVAVNAVGAVRDPATGRWVAGARGPRGRIVPPRLGSERGAPAGTTLTVLMTDLRVERPALQRIALEAHAALGGAIVPFHTATDGDVLFAAATGVAGAPPPETRPGGLADALGGQAAECAIGATLGAVRAANRRR